MMRYAHALFAVAIAMLCAGCSLVPSYERPVVAVPASFKEEPGWQPAAPSDSVARGEWWTLLGDANLDALEKQVLVSNQNLAAATAAYDQARALVQEQRAALLPVIDLQAGATRTGSNDANTTISTTDDSLSNSGRGGKRFTTSVGASWEVDVFGRLRASVSQAGALAQASAADLANATLAAQGELALDYVQLRALDAQSDILTATIAAYERALQITTNRYNAGVVARADVLQAQTQLHNARADAADLGRQRATLEHAIAVLVGENPSTFALEKSAWAPRIPDVPAILPSTLLERRPDIASAERRVSAANDAIGIERSAFFPSLDLTASLGASASSLGALFDAGSGVWSLGASGLLTLLDFGARSARVEEAKAAYAQTVAEYRQTVLTAFQQTEDELAATRVLASVEQERSAATAAANQAEQLMQNQYLAGQVSYADVISTQTVALSARQASVNAALDRQTAAIALMQAIGGFWNPDAR